MKIFIVFLSFALVFSCFLLYIEDSDDYILVQKNLKTLAEECAEAGALTIDEEKLIIDRTTAYKEAKRILKADNTFPGGSVAVKEYYVSEDGLSFGIVLEYTKERMFRLPFIKIKSITRKSEYGWK